MILCVTSYVDLEKKMASNNNYISYYISRNGPHKFFDNIFIYNEHTNQFTKINWRHFWNTYPRLFFTICDENDNNIWQNMNKYHHVLDLPNICKYFLFEKRFFQNKEFLKYCATNMKFCNDHDFIFSLPSDFQKYVQKNNYIVNKARMYTYCFIVQNIIRSIVTASKDVFSFLEVLTNNIQTHLKEQQDHMDKIDLLSRQYVKVDMIMEAVTHSCEKYVYEIAQPMMNNAIDLSWRTFYDVESKHTSYIIPVNLLHETLKEYEKWKNE